jgi:lipopolysaccharide transport system permease protein
MSAFAYHRDLVSHLVRRDLTLRYHGSAIGILWSLAIPLAQLVVLVFLFQKVIPLGIDFYPGFLFSALLPWVWFTSCLGSAGGLFVNNRALLWQTSFSPFVLVLVNILANLVLFLMLVPLLLILLLAHGTPVTAAWMMVPGLIAIEGLMLFGLSLLVATLNVFYRDVQQVVNLGVFLLFYLTPVFYRVDALPETYRALYALNPLGALIESYRMTIFYGQSPNLWPVMVALTFAILAAGFGVAVYRYRLHDVMDVV